MSPRFSRYAPVLSPFAVGDSAEPREIIGFPWVNLRGDSSHLRRTFARQGKGYVDGMNRAHGSAKTTLFAKLGIQFSHIVFNGYGLRRAHFTAFFASQAIILFYYRYH